MVLPEVRRAVQWGGIVRHLEVTALSVSREGRAVIGTVACLMPSSSFCFQVTDTGVRHICPFLKRISGIVVMCEYIKEEERW